MCGFVVVVGVWVVSGSGGVRGLGWMIEWENGLIFL